MTKLNMDHGETRKIGNIIVRATRVIGTKIVFFSAWEPSAVMGRHHTITTFEGDWYGQIGSRPLPAAIEALKGGSPERLAALATFREEQRSEAFAAIRAAFPDVAFTDAYDYELEAIAA